jgi:hypothetical protein
LIVPRVSPRQRAAAIGLAVLAVLVVLAVARPWRGGEPAALTDNAYPTATVAVARESIAAQTQASATLGYAGDVTVRLAAGNAPAVVAQARQSVAADRAMLASARSTRRRRWRAASSW